MNYDSDHEISSWYEYEYDDNGNMISSTFTYENGGSSAYSRFEWTYDDDGNKLTETNLTKDGEISNFYEYSYDNGKMITKKYYYCGELQSTSTYTYTDFGKVDTCTTDNSGETTTKKYTYITMELPVGWTESD